MNLARIQIQIVLNLYNLLVATEPDKNSDSDHPQSLYSICTCRIQKRATVFMLFVVLLGRIVFFFC
jgi:hypothetical protein